MHEGRVAAIHLHLQLQPPLPCIFYSPTASSGQRCKSFSCHFFGSCVCSVCFGLRVHLLVQPVCILFTAYRTIEIILCFFLLLHASFHTVCVCWRGCSESTVCACFCGVGSGCWEAQCVRDLVYSAVCCNPYPECQSLRAANWKALCGMPALHRASCPDLQKLTFHQKIFNYAWCFHPGTGGLVFALSGHKFTGCVIQFKILDKHPNQFFCLFLFV